MPFNPYEILGVKLDCSTEDLRRAYRALARKYHPDINKSEEAERYFKEIGHAYSILADPHQRALFDEFGEASLSLTFNPELARRQRRAEEVGMDEEAEQFYYSDPQYYSPSAWSSQKESPHVVTTLKIDLAMALLGGEVKVASPITGASLVVSIPPGVETGYRLHLKGHGRPGNHGTKPGDLFFSIQVQPHPYFRRDGQDLFLDLPITLDEAFHGAPIEIPTLEGWIEVPIPAGTRGGERLLVRGKGLTDHDGQRRGDLYVHLCIRLPERLDAAARSFERLSHLYLNPVRKGLRL